MVILCLPFKYERQISIRRVNVLFKSTGHLLSVLRRSLIPLGVRSALQRCEAAARLPALRRVRRQVGAAQQALPKGQAADALQQQAHLPARPARAVVSAS